MRASCSSQASGRVRGGERAGDRLAEQGELGGELGASLAVEAVRGGGASRVARARLTPPRTSAIRSRMAVRTVASPMSRPATTSVTVRSPSASSSRRAATGAASATVAIASASATSCSMSAWWPAKASSRARKATARWPKEARSASTSAASSSMRAVSAYRMSLRVSRWPWAWRSSVRPVDPGGGAARGLAAQTADQRGDPRGGLVECVGGLPGQRLDGLELGQHLLGGGPHLRPAARAGRRVRARPASGRSRRPGRRRRPVPRTPRSSGWSRSTARVRDRQSEMPRTRSALPTRASGPVPTGWAAA